MSTATTPDPGHPTTPSSSSTASTNAPVAGVSAPVKPATTSTPTPPDSNAGAAGVTKHSPQLPNRESSTTTAGAPTALSDAKQSPQGPQPIGSSPGGTPRPISTHKDDKKPELLGSEEETPEQEEARTRGGLDTTPQMTPEDHALEVAKEQEEKGHEDYAFDLVGRSNVELLSPSDVVFVRPHHSASIVAMHKTAAEDRIVTVKAEEMRKHATTGEMVQVLTTDKDEKVVLFRTSIERYKKDELPSVLVKI